MGLFSPDLNQDIVHTLGTAAATTEAAQKRTFPKTITEFLTEVSRIGRVSEKLSKLDDYVKRLEIERKKIDASKQEFPLCMILLSDAILALKEEYNKLNVQPILEEFIPLKKNCDYDEDEVKDLGETKEVGYLNKKHWLSSVRLWYSTDDEPLEADLSSKQISISDKHKNVLEEEDRATSEDILKLIKKLKEDVGCVGSNSSLIGNEAISSCINSSKRAVNQSQYQTSRKQRRSWSPELHRRFVDAVQQLGGCNVATPKQIRDHMKVEGLTNDEVKSHLQKYRLHSRRIPSSTYASSSNAFIIFDGLCGKSSEHSISEFDSPHSHLQLGGVFNATSLTESDSTEEEEEEKSNSHFWKTEINLSRNNL